MSLLAEITEGIATLVAVGAFVGALLLIADAVAHRPAPPSITDIAPACADAPRPCKGGLS